MAIDNVLGSGGYSGGFLGNLTSGLQAIQMTEIQRRINDIQQQKAWDRDDRLRNEKFALEMALPKVAQDRRLALANETAKKVSDYNKQLVEFSKVADSGARMSDEERMKKQLELVTAKNTLLQESAAAAAMNDVIDKGRSDYIKILGTLTDPNERQAYMKQMADFNIKLQDPVQSKYLVPSDYLTALQPPDPSTSTVFAKTTKDLLPFVDSAIKAEGGGRTSVDFDKLKKVIASNVDQNSYLYQKGIQEGRWKNVDEMYNQMAERIAPSIKTDVVGWKPNEPTEKEKFSGFGGTYKSAVSGENVSNSYIFDQWGTPIETSFTLPDGRVTSAKMTPLAIKPNSKLEAEFTVTQRVISDPMSQGQALFLKQQTGGTVLPKDENGMYSVSYNQPTKYTDEVQLSPDAIEKIKRRDPNAAKYIGELEPYPTRVGKQETKTTKSAKTNKYGI